MSPEVVLTLLSIAVTLMIAVAAGMWKMFEAVQKVSEYQTNARHGLRNEVALKFTEAEDRMAERFRETEERLQRRIERLEDAQRRGGDC